MSVFDNLFSIFSDKKDEVKANRKFIKKHKNADLFLVDSYLKEISAVYIAPSSKHREKEIKYLFSYVSKMMELKTE